MKDDLLKWVNDRRELDVTSKFVLYRLAQFADARCWAWAEVKTLADACNVSERTVQYRLEAMKADGLMEATGEFHTIETKRGPRKVPLYQLAAGVPGLDSRGDTGAKSAPVSRDGCKKSTIRVQAVAPHKELIGTEEVVSNEPTSSAEAREDCSFDAALAAYPASGAKVTNVPDAAQLWVALTMAIEPARLLAAVRAFAADPDLKRRDFGAPAFQRWLSEGRWRFYLPTDGAQGPPAAVTSFDGPPELRVEAIGERGEAKVASYLDPCGWDPDGRVLLPRTRLAADWLRENLRGVLRAHGVEIGPVGRVCEPVG